MKNLKTVFLPRMYEYIGAFLTFDCNLKCPYCINRFGDFAWKNPPLNYRPAEQWLTALTRIMGIHKTGTDILPVTLCGGEPTCHPQFYDIVRGLYEYGYKTDLLTNLSFNVQEFVDNVPADVFIREIYYPTIRVSFHATVMPNTKAFRKKFIDKVCFLRDSGYPIGIYTINTEEGIEANKSMAQLASVNNIAFYVKPYLGYDDNGVLRGRYTYPEALNEIKRKAKCRTRELLISPSLDIYRCHHDLYKDINPLGSLLDKDVSIDYMFRNCDNLGKCNPCDVKSKTSRHGTVGYTSVDIIDVVKEQETEYGFEKDFKSDSAGKNKKSGRKKRATRSTNAVQPDQTPDNQ